MVLVLACAEPVGCPRGDKDHECESWGQLARSSLTQAIGHSPSLGITKRYQTGPHGQAIGHSPSLGIINRYQTCKSARPHGQAICHSPSLGNINRYQTGQRARPHGHPSQTKATATISSEKKATPPAPDTWTIGKGLQPYPDIRRPQITTAYKSWTGLGKQLPLVSTTPSYKPEAHLPGPLGTVAHSNTAVYRHHGPPGTAHAVTSSSHSYCWFPPTASRGMDMDAGRSYRLDTDIEPFASTIVHDEDTANRAAVRAGMEQFKAQDQEQQLVLYHAQHRSSTYEVRTNRALASHTANHTKQLQLQQYTGQLILSCVKHQLTATAAVCCHSLRHAAKVHMEGYQQLQSGRQAAYHRAALCETMINSSREGMLQLQRPTGQPTLSHVSNQPIATTAVCCQSSSHADNRTPFLLHLENCQQFVHHVICHRQVLHAEALKFSNYRYHTTNTTEHGRLRQPIYDFMDSTNGTAQPDQWPIFLLIGLVNALAMCCYYYHQHMTDDAEYQHTADTTLTSQQYYQPWRERYWRLYAMARRKQMRLHTYQARMLKRCAHALKSTRARLRDDVLHNKHSPILFRCQPQHQPAISRLYMHLYDEEMERYGLKLSQQVSEQADAHDMCETDPASASKATEGHREHNTTPKPHLQSGEPTHIHGTGCKTTTATAKGGGYDQKWQPHQPALARILVNRLTLRDLNLHTEPQDNAHCGAIALNVLLNKPVFRKGITVFVPPAGS